MSTIETEINILKEENYDLVQGVFKPDEAREITHLLIHTWVNFLKLQNLSHQMRFGTVDEALLKSIHDMEISQASIDQVIHDANHRGKSLKLHSNISISSF